MALPEEQEPEGGFWNALGRGTDQAQAMLYAFSSAIGQATGVDWLEEWGIEGMEHNIAQMLENPPEIETWDDVDSLASFGMYVVERVGEQVPSLAGQLLAYAGGAAVGSAIAPGAGTGTGVAAAHVGTRAAISKIAAARIGKAVKRRVGQKAFQSYTSKQIAAVAGGVTARNAFMMGQNAGETQMQILTEGEEAPWTALGTGIAKGALDAYGLDRVLGAAKKMGVSPAEAVSVASRMARNAGYWAGGAIWEGGTEGIQTALDQIALGHVTGENKMDANEIKESMIAGGVVGGALGGGMSTYQMAKNYASYKADRFLENELALQPEYFDVDRGAWRARGAGRKGQFFDVPQEVEEAKPEGRKGEFFDVEEEAAPETPDTRKGEFFDVDPEDIPKPTTTRKGEFFDVQPEDVPEVIEGRQGEYFDVAEDAEPKAPEGRKGEYFDVVEEEFTPDIDLLDPNFNARDPEERWLQDLVRRADTSASQDKNKTAGVGIADESQADLDAQFASLLDPDSPKQTVFVPATNGYQIPEQTVQDAQNDGRRWLDEAGEIDSSVNQELLAADDSTLVESDDMTARMKQSFDRKRFGKARDITAMMVVTDSGPGMIYTNDLNVKRRLNEPGALKDEELGAILYGRPEGKMDSDGSAVVAEDAEGNVISQVNSSPETRRQDIDNATRMVGSSGGQVRVIPVTEMHDERAAKVQLEEQKKAAVDRKTLIDQIANRVVDAEASVGPERKARRIEEGIDAMDAQVTKIDEALTLIEPKVGSGEVIFGQTPEELKTKLTRERNEVSSQARAARDTLESTQEPVSNEVLAQRKRNVIRYLDEDAVDEEFNAARGLLDNFDDNAAVMAASLIAHAEQAGKRPSIQDAEVFNAGTISTIPIREEAITDTQAEPDVRQEAIDERNADVVEDEESSREMGNTAFARESMEGGLIRNPVAFTINPRDNKPGYTGQRQAVTDEEKQVGLGYARYKYAKKQADKLDKQYPLDNTVREVVPYEFEDGRRAYVIREAHLPKEVAPTEYVSQQTAKKTKRSYATVTPETQWVDAEDAKTRNKAAEAKKGAAPRNPYGLDTAALTQDMIGPTRENGNQLSQEANQLAWAFFGRVAQEYNDQHSDRTPIQAKDLRYGKLQNEAVEIAHAVAPKALGEYEQQMARYGGAVVYGRDPNAMPRKVDLVKRAEEISAWTPTAGKKQPPALTSNEAAALQEGKREVTLSPETTPLSVRDIATLGRTTMFTEGRTSEAQPGANDMEGFLRGVSMLEMMGWDFDVENGPYVQRSGRQMSVEGDFHQKLQAAQDKVAAVPEGPQRELAQRDLETLKRESSRRTTRAVRPNLLLRHGVIKYKGSTGGDVTVARAYGNPAKAMTPEQLSAFRRPFDRYVKAHADWEKAGRKGPPPLRPKPDVSGAGSVLDRQNRWGEVDSINQVIADIRRQARDAESQSERKALAETVKQLQADRASLLALQADRYPSDPMHGLYDGGFDEPLMDAKPSPVAADTSNTQGTTESRQTLAYQNYDNMQDRAFSLARKMDEIRKEFVRFGHRRGNKFILERPATKAERDARAHAVATLRQEKNKGIAFKDMDDRVYLDAELQKAEARLRAAKQAYRHSRESQGADDAGWAQLAKIDKEIEALYAERLRIRNVKAHRESIHLSPVMDETRPEARKRDKKGDYVDRPLREMLPDYGMRDWEAKVLPVLNARENTIFKRREKLEQEHADVEFTTPAGQRIRKAQIAVRDAAQDVRNHELGIQEMLDSRRTNPSLKLGIDEAISQLQSKERTDNETLTLSALEQYRELNDQLDSTLAQMDKNKAAPDPQQKLAGGWNPPGFSHDEDYQVLKDAQLDRKKGEINKGVTLDASGDPLPYHTGFDAKPTRQGNVVVAPHSQGRIPTYAVPLAAGILREFHSNTPVEIINLSDLDSLGLDNAASIKQVFRSPAVFARSYEVTVAGTTRQVLVVKEQPSGLTRDQKARYEYAQYLSIGAAVLRIPVLEQAQNVTPGQLKKMKAAWRADVKKYDLVNWKDKQLGFDNWVADKTTQRARDLLVKPQSVTDRLFRDTAQKLRRKWEWMLTPENMAQDGGPAMTQGNKKFASRKSVEDVLDYTARDYMNEPVTWIPDEPTPAPELTAAPSRAEVGSQKYPGSAHRKSIRRQIYRWRVARGATNISGKEIGGSVGHDRPVIMDFYGKTRIAVTFESNAADARRQVNTQLQRIADYDLTTKEKKHNIEVERTGEGEMIHRPFEPYSEDIHPDTKALYFKDWRGRSFLQYIQERAKSPTGTYEAAPRVILITENLVDKDDAIRTLRHEILGHHTLDSLISPYMRGALLDRIRASRKIPGLRELYTEVDRKYPDMDLDLRDEEVIARAAEVIVNTKLTDVTGRARENLKRLRDLFLRALRRVGLIKSGTITETEIQDGLRRVADYPRTPGYLATTKFAARGAYDRHVRAFPGDAQRLGAVTSAAYRNADMADQATIDKLWESVKAFANGVSDLGGIRALASRQAVMHAIDPVLAAKVYHRSQSKYEGVSAGAEIAAQRAKWTGQLYALTKNWDADTKERVHEELVTEVPYDKKSPEAKAITDLATNFGAYLEQHVEGFKPVENFFPRHYQTIRMRSEPDKVMAMFKKHGMDEDQATETFEKLTGDASESYQDDAVIVEQDKVSFSRHRTFSASPALLKAMMDAEYLTPDPEIALRQHMEKAIKRAEMEHALGGMVPRASIEGLTPQDYAWFNALSKEQQQDVGAAFDHYTRTGEEQIPGISKRNVTRSEYNPVAAVFNAQDHLPEAQMKRMLKLVKESLLQVPMDRNSEAFHVLSEIKAFESWRLLLGSGLASIPEIAGIYSRSQGDISAREFGQALTDTFRKATKQDMEDFAMALGIMGQDKNAAMATELVNVQGGKQGFFAGNLSAMFKYNGNNAVVNVTRKMAAALGKTFLIRQAVTLGEAQTSLTAAHGATEQVRLRNGRVNPLVPDADKVKVQHAIDNLASLGIQDHNDILMWDHEGQPLWESNTLLRDDPANQRTERVQRAITMFSQESVINPTGAERPSYADSLLGQMAFHLKAFMYAFNTVIIQGMMRQFSNAMDRSGELPSRLKTIAPMVPYLVASMGMFLAMGGISDEMRRRIFSFGERGSLDQARGDFSKLIGQWAERSGFIQLPFYDFLFRPTVKQLAYELGPTASHMHKLQDMLTKEDPQVARAVFHSTPILSQLPTARRTLYKALEGEDEEKAATPFVEEQYAAERL